MSLNREYLRQIMKNNCFVSNDDDNFAVPIENNHYNYQKSQDYYLKNPPSLDNFQV